MALLLKKSVGEKKNQFLGKFESTSFGVFRTFSKTGASIFWGPKNEFHSDPLSFSRRFKP
jgi:hypothetical protein